MFYLEYHIKALIGKIKTSWYRLFMGKVGEKTVISIPSKVHNPKSIYLMKNIYIDAGSWLYAVNEVESRLYIGEKTQIGRFFHCVAYNNVEIQDNVLIAERVFISDCNHQYRSINKPILEQGVYPISSVVVGSGTWIGEGASIIGAKIGKNCVIGANAVVLTDVEDYCVAVGNPAKIVKRYNEKLKLWEKVN